MKTNTRNIKKTLLYLAMILLAGTANAQYSARIYVTNEVQINATTYQFDIYLLNTTTGTPPIGIYPANALECAGVQFGLGFDVSMFNPGSTLTPQIVAGTSDMVALEVPNTVSVGGAAQTNVVGGKTYRYFNCAGRAAPGGGLGTVISDVNNSCAAPGTRLSTFRLISSTGFTTNARPNHIFNQTLGSGRTNTGMTAYEPPGPGGINSTVPVTLENFNTTNPPTCDPNITLNINCNNNFSAVGHDAICVGGTGTATVTVTGTPVRSDGSYFVDGGFAQAYTSNPFTISGLAPGSHTIHVVTGTPCTLGTVTVSISGPTIPFTMGACSATDVPCNGTTGTVSAGTISDNSGPVTYSWLNSSFQQVANTATASLPAGTYTLTASDACLSQSCTVTINPFPGTNVPPSGISANKTVYCTASCSGGPSAPVVLNVLGSLTPGSTGEWYTDSCGGTPAGSGASLAVTPSVTTTYFVRAENSCGLTTCYSITIVAQ